MPRIDLNDAEWTPPAVSLPKVGHLWQVRPRRKMIRKTIRKCKLSNGQWQSGPWEEPAGPGSTDIKVGLWTSAWEYLCENPDLTAPDEWKPLVLPTSPTPISNPEAVIDALKATVPAGKVHSVVEPAEPPKFGRWPAWVSKLQVVPHETPYTHQVDALRYIEDGKHLAIATGTASGKSMCYMLPILREVVGDPECRALYIAPAKSLCDDQLRSWREGFGGDETSTAPVACGNVSGSEVCVIRYDADTKQEVAEYRNTAQVVLTNTSMLNWMLRRNSDWPQLFSKLRFVVLDEIHEAKGVRGAHLAWLIRRLRRLVQRQNPDAPPIQFVCCSATIGNPGELAQQIIGDGREVKVVAKDTSGHGQRHFVSWTPPEVENSSRRGTVALDLVKGLLTGEAGPHQTIVFHRSRPEANLTARYQHDQLLENGRADLAQGIQTFMSNLTAEARRAILDELHDGTCTVVFATSALELGIDIGDLSAAVILGIPHSRAGFRQMSGRVGRRADDQAVVLFVPRQNPLDDWFADEEHFEKQLARAEPEPVITDPDNEVVAMQHIAAAAKELPLNAEDDAPFFGNHLAFAMDKLERDGNLAEDTEGLLYWSTADEPAARINVLASRGTHTIEIRRRKDRAAIGQVDNWTALWMLFPGAIYEDGIRDTYVVTSLHIGSTDQQDATEDAQRVAWVRKAKAEESRYYTIAITDKDIEIVDAGQVTSSKISSLQVKQGPIKLTSSLGDSYWRVRRAEGSQSSRKRQKLPLRKAPTAIGPDGREIEFPKLILETDGLWFSIPPSILNKIQKRAERRLSNDKPGEAKAKDLVLSALHGAEHLMCKMTGVVRGICDDDISGLSTLQHDAFEGSPGIFIHENTPGGSGLIQRILKPQNFRAVLQAALEQVQKCRCKDGCPGCVLDRLCGNENSFLDKEGSRLLLQELVAAAAK